MLDVLGNRFVIPGGLGFFEFLSPSPTPTLPSGQDTMSFFPTLDTDLATVIPVM